MGHEEDWAPSGPVPTVPYHEIPKVRSRTQDADVLLGEPGQMQTLGNGLGGLHRSASSLGGLDGDQLGENLPGEGLVFVGLLGFQGKQLASRQDADDGESCGSNHDSDLQTNGPPLSLLPN